MGVSHTVEPAVQLRLASWVPRTWSSPGTLKREKITQKRWCLRPLSVRAPALGWGVLLHRHLKQKSKVQSVVESPGTPLSRFMQPLGL